MNFYQRMGILPLKRVNRDKCSFTTKQRTFGVFAIDEILRYRWTRFAGSRTLCHPAQECSMNKILVFSPIFNSILSFPVFSEIERWKQMLSNNCAAPGGGFEGDFQPQPRKLRRPPPSGQGVISGHYHITQKVFIFNGWKKDFSMIFLMMLMMLWSKWCTILHFHFILGANDFIFSTLCE